MGLEFIYKTAKPSSKAWRAEFENASRDLFSVQGNQIDRTYLAPVCTKGVLCIGDDVHVRLIDQKVYVCKELQVAAEIEKPSLDLVETLVSCSGILSAQIEEVYELAEVVSVHVGKDKNKP